MLVDNKLEVDRVFFFSILEVDRVEGLGRRLWTVVVVAVMLVVLVAIVIIDGKDERELKVEYIWM